MRFADGADIRRSVRPSVGTELVSVPSVNERNGKPASAGKSESSAGGKRLGKFTGLSERGLVG